MIPIRISLGWLVIAGASLVSTGVAQTPPSAEDMVALAGQGDARRTPAELEDLLGPIALYPDALIALILPAATASTDVVLAARHLRNPDADPTPVESRPWDESVKSLVHYPEVLRWMDENLEWTKQVGTAFLEQPVEVMQAIQRLRARAQSAGALASTPQQQVLTDFDVIRIVPAQGSFLYVPYYDPALVFVDRPWGYSRPALAFGFGLPVGSWLAYDLDWRRHTIWVGNRYRNWSGHDWRQPVVPIPVVAPPYARHHEVRPWRPPPPGSRPPPPAMRPPLSETRPPPPDGAVHPPRPHVRPKLLSPPSQPDLASTPPRQVTPPENVERRPPNSAPPSRRRVPATVGTVPAEVAVAPTPATVPSEASAPARVAPATTQSRRGPPSERASSQSTTTTTSTSSSSAPSQDAARHYRHSGSSPAPQQASPPSAAPRTAPSAPPPSRSAPSSTYSAPPARSAPPPPAASASPPPARSAPPPAPASAPAPSSGDRSSGRTVPNEK